MFGLRQTSQLAERRININQFNKGIRCLSTRSARIDSQKCRAQCTLKIGLFAPQ